MIAVIQHVPYEGMGTLEKVFDEAGISYQYFAADDIASPDDSSSCSIDLAKVSALVVMGGPMGVYETERYPFIMREIELIKASLHRQIPTLGICLGAQLLAAAGGAKVYPGPRKEIGWFPLALKPEAKGDRLLKHCPKPTMVFHWHGDTFDLPKGARHLASSERYPHQAFRMGESAWGFQFHLEMTEGMIRGWVGIAEEKSKVPHPDWDGDEILSETPCFLPEMQRLAGKVFGEFARMIVGQV